MKFNLFFVTLILASHSSAQIIVGGNGPLMQSNAPKLFSPYDVSIYSSEGLKQEDATAELNISFSTPTQPKSFNQFDESTVGLNSKPSVLDYTIPKSAKQLSHAMTNAAHNALRMHYGPGKVYSSSQFDQYAQTLRGFGFATMRKLGKIEVTYGDDPKITAENSAVVIETPDGSEVIMDFEEALSFDSDTED